MKMLSLAATFAIFVAYPLNAQDFDLKDEALAEKFRAEAEKIIKDGLTPEQKLFYGIQNSGEIDDIEKISEFTILREAYRADPEATLDLIRRIMEAGKLH
jgi:hypothetical protein